MIGSPLAFQPCQIHHIHSSSETSLIAEVDLERLPLLGLKEICIAAETIRTSGLGFELSRSEAYSSLCKYGRCRVGCL